MSSCRTIIPIWSFILMVFLWPLIIKRRFGCNGNPNLREVIAEVMEKHKLKTPSPSLSFPQHLIENKNGVGVYYNPDEGARDYDWLSILL